MNKWKNICIQKNYCHLGLDKICREKQAAQPLPVVGMGLFMNYDGIPLAFDT